MKELMRKAHQMTREIVEKYNDVDYKTQFALCLQVVIEDKRAEDVIQKEADSYRPSGSYVYGLTRKQVGVIFANYKNGNLDITKEDISFLYNKVADKKHYKLGLSAQTRDSFDRLHTALNLVFAKCYFEASEEIKRAHRIYGY